MNPGVIYIKAYCLLLGIDQSIRFLMKSFFTIVAATLLFLSCNPSAEQPAMVPNSDRVAKIYDAFARGDGAAVMAQFDPEIVWNEAENFLYAGGNPYKGPDAVANGVFGPIGAEWDNFRLEMVEFHNLDDDGVLVTGRYRGTYKATGKELDAQFAHVWKLRDTLAVSFQQYTDTWQALQVATPEPGAPGEVGK